MNVNRIRKVLGGANSKLSIVGGDVPGVSGRDLLETLTQGREASEQLAELARGTCARNAGPWQKPCTV